MILGSIAFESYDHMIHLMDGRERSNAVHANAGHNSQDSYTQSTIPQHFLSGAFSGCIYSVSLLTWDGIGTILGPKMVHPPPSPLVFTVMSNSISHSILYGSYEGIKRTLWERESSSNEKIKAPTTLDVSIFGISGGTAGVLHHICSHAMERWKDGMSISIHKESGQVLLEKIKTLIPTGKSTLFAFVSHAIGFVAFECGKELMTDAMH